MESSDTKIKILQKTRAYPFLGTPGERLDGCAFTTDASCRDYDWLVVFDEFDGVEELACPRERTILATWEPVSIKGYSPAYVRQFGHLLTNRPPEAERHPHTHLGRGYFYWFNGRSYSDSAAAVIPEKTETISIVCSAKKMSHTRHLDRFRLASAIARGVPELAWFGAGVRPVSPKYRALDPYRYHVAIENHIAPHHWTEKLADALLSECLPFYAGDPAIGEALPPECLVPIPIDDPEGAVAIIRDAIASDEYSRRIGAVREAKRLLLGKYNFWSQVAAIVEAERGQAVAPADVSRPQFVRSRRALRWSSPAAALGEFWMHLKRGF